MKLKYFRDSQRETFFVIFCVFLLLSTSSFAGLELRLTPLKMTTSIIIPCHYAHFEHIEELLEHYKHQSVIPDEVVISLSGSAHLSADVINKIRDAVWPFRLIINESSQILSAGQNRNIACTLSLGDLLICQDADDLPHPQRVEIIKYLFENFMLDHLMHFFYYTRANYDIKTTQYSLKLDEIDPLVDYGYRYEDVLSEGGGTLGQIAIHNGNVAITRSLFEEVKWPELFNRREDTDFNIAVYQRFPYKALLKFPLIFYRQFLSTDERARRIGSSG